METDSRYMLVPGGCGWTVGEWVVTADGFRVCFRGEGNVWEPDRNDACSPP